MKDCIEYVRASLLVLVISIGTTFEQKLGAIRVTQRHLIHMQLNNELQFDADLDWFMNVYLRRRGRCIR